MKLYLVRHGETNYNVLRLCNSDPSVDVHLTERGLQQVHDLAERLKPVHFDHIYVSELRRTQDSAKIINEFHGASIAVDSRLNDNDSGYEGRSLDDYYKAFSTSKDKWSTHFNEGESIEEAIARVKLFIDELRTKDYDTVLVVTSMFVIQAFLTLIGGMTTEEAWAHEIEKASCRELTL